MLRFLLALLTTIARPLPLPFLHRSKASPAWSPWSNCGTSLSRQHIIAHLKCRGVPYQANADRAGLLKRLMIEMGAVMLVTRASVV